LETQKVGNIKVGRPDVTPEAPSHIAGVREGNRRAHLLPQPGFEGKGLTARANSRRSTGVNARAEEPIDPRMPRLFPP
jgi:hypothetical protein